MRALVLGGSRFLGQSLVQQLAQARFEITVINRESADLLYPEGVRHVKADRRDLPTMKEILAPGSWDVVYDLICSDPTAAQESVELFRDKTTRYVYASSCFVYSYGQNINEEQFAAQSYELPSGDFKNLTGTESRRVTEAILAQQAGFKTVAARLPFVIGEGDPTKKLFNLIRMVLTKEAIAVPNAAAKFSMIHVDDAAKAILRLGLYPQEGAMNCAAENPVTFSSLLKMIEDETYCTVRRAEKIAPENTTVFSLKNDWFVDTSRLRTLDVHPKPPGSVLPELIRKISRELSKAAI